MAWTAMGERHGPSAQQGAQSMLPMGLSDLLDSFAFQPRPERRASVMITEQVHLDISKLAPAVGPELRGLINQISSQAKVGTAAEAVRIYHQLSREQPSLLTSPSLLNAVLDCHAKCPDGSARAAATILDAAIAAGQAYDTVTFNTVINAMAKKNDGSARLADRLLGRMRSNSIPPTLVTFNTLIDAHSRQPDGSARTAITHLTELLGLGIVPDQSTFTTVINLQARLSDGSAAAAFRVLDLMRRAGVPPNTIILNSVIDAQSKQMDGQARVALLVLEAMRKSHGIESVKPNVVTYTAVIDCTAKCQDGDATTALHLLREMAESGLQPNHITYGTLINAMAKRGSARNATALLKQMMASNLKPTLVAFNSVLHAHARGEDGSAAEALVLLQSMKEHGLSPNTISYSSCIDAQAKKPDGSAETAAQLLERAVAEGVVPDKVMFTAVFDAQAKRRDGSPKRAAALLEMMSSSSWVSPNEIHFNAVMNACASARPADIATAKQVFGLMTQRFKPNEYTLSAMLRCCTFSEPPEPETAWHLFKDFGGGIRINDHIERALCGAVSERAANELFAAVGHTPTSDRRRRRSHGGNNRRRNGGGGGSGRDHRYDSAAPPAARNWNEGSWRLPSDEAYSSMGTPNTSDDEQHYSPPLPRSGLSTLSAPFCPQDRSAMPSPWTTFGTAPQPMMARSAPESAWPTYGASPVECPPMGGATWAPTSAPLTRSTSDRSTPPGLVPASSPWATFGKTPQSNPSVFSSTLMTARRLSLSSDQPAGGSRRGSLAGSAALEVASIPRLNTQAVDGLAAALNGGADTVESKSPPQRRLSLAEKVAQIKAGGVGEDLPASKESPPQSRLAPIGSEVASSPPGGQGRCHSQGSDGGGTPGSDCVSTSPVLLGPDHFKTSKTVSGVPDTAGMKKSVHRLPDNPDGTRGFGGRRRASIDSANALVQASATAPRASVLLEAC